MQDTKNFIEKIIIKKFGVRTKGYDPKEVDETFDLLLDKIRDLSFELDNLNKKIDSMNDEINELKINNEQLKNIKISLELQVEEYLKSGFHNEAFNRRLSDIENTLSKKEKK